MLLIIAKLNENNKNLAKSLDETNKKIKNYY